MDLYYLNAVAEFILCIAVHNVRLTKTGVTRCVTANTSLLVVNADGCEILVLESMDVSCVVKIVYCVMMTVELEGFALVGEA